MALCLLIIIIIVMGSNKVKSGDINRRNKKVYAWTVDEEESMQKMLSEVVDAVVTSNPSLLQRVMHDLRTQCFEQGFSMSM